MYFAIRFYSLSSANSLRRNFYTFGADNPELIPLDKHGVSYRRNPTTAVIVYPRYFNRIRKFSLKMLGFSAAVVNLVPPNKHYSRRFCSNQTRASFGSDRFFPPFFCSRLGIKDVNGIRIPGQFPNACVDNTRLYAPYISPSAQVARHARPTHLRATPSDRILRATVRRGAYGRTHECPIRGFEGPPRPRQERVTRR